MRIGIIGTGRIAHRMAAVMGELCEAVYQPKKDSAEKFAMEEKISFASDDWESFAQRVDAVYIASPHGTHEAYVRRALLAGKHVLCEKPMAFTEQSCRELFAMARERNLVLMEEMKTEDCPGFKSVLSDVGSGIIGEVTDVEAAFTRLTPSCFRERTDIDFGGSFTELGSYGMLPIFRILGTGYDDVRFISRYDWNGLDLYTKAIFTYGEGRFTKTATVKTGLGVKSEGQLLISGTDGYILVPSPWWLTKYYEIHFEDPNRIIRRNAVYEGSGLQYRLQTFLERITGTATLEEQDGNDQRGWNRISSGEDMEASSRISEEEAVARASVFEKFLRENREMRMNLRKQKGAALEPLYADNNTHITETHRTRW